MNAAVYEHLSSQSMCTDIAESGILPDAFVNATAAAFETAVLLAAELDACGDYVQSTWFEAGSMYDAQRMKPSIHATPPDAKQKATAITLLPGVDVRRSGGSWVQYANATVRVLALD